jgi:glycosyltransferase involved in cell wall biosynthesis
MELRNNPEISVILPVYNGAAYIAEAVKSILEQTFANFELIVIDDCSTDNTLEVLSEFRDERLRIIDKRQNSGITDSLNTGISQARGNFIARMDADDISMPGRLASQHEYLNEHPAAVIAGCDYYVMTNGRLVRSCIDDDSDYLKAILMFATCYAHPTVLVRNIFPKTGLHYDKSFLHAEDYRLWTQLALHGEFGNVQEPLLKYRSHDDQVSSKYRDIQVGNSDRIRRDYLRRLGFNFTEEQFRIHQVISNNEFITSRQTLDAIEAWLTSLCGQNLASKIFNTRSFEKMTAKFWSDSCGFSNLGWYAFKRWGSSPLSHEQRTMRHAVRMAAKCLLRSYRK